MLAPSDKLRSGVNRIIQIDVSVLCDRRCANCTRLIPWRKGGSFMAVDVFREAIEALRDWPGVIGIMGSNPCLHPRFPELMEILCEVIPDQKRRGLWTNNLLKHGETCHRVFWPAGMFNLNCHQDPEAAEGFRKWLPGKIIQSSIRQPSWHGSILMHRCDYGVDDETWVGLRESCDINQKWSGMIAERDGAPYIWFCEIASSLDGIRGENNGVKVEPGCWRWTMDRFEHQVRQCCDRGCGVPLRLKGHLDRDETYDLSPSWARELEGRKMRQKVATAVHERLPGEKSRELTDYQRLRSRP